jgi:hypothetical protein
LAATLVALLAVPTALAKAKHVGACEKHRKRAIVVTARVLVYGRAAGEDSFASPLTVYYACTRPGGAGVRVGANAPSDGEYPAQETTSRIKVAGTYVAAVSSSGAGDAAACSKYSGTDAGCPSVKSWVEALDARTHRSLSLPIAAGAGPTALVVCASGAVAWIEQTVSTSTLRAVVLHRGAPRRLAGTVQTLDTGDIARFSLHINGLTLRWTTGGQPKQLTLI